MKVFSILSISSALLVASNLVLATHCVDKPGCHGHHHWCGHHPHGVCKRQQQQQQNNPLFPQQQQQQNNPLFPQQQQQQQNDPQATQQQQQQNDPQATQQQQQQQPSATASGPPSTQSIPASIFANLPSFLGISFPGLVAGPTSTAASPPVPTTATNRPSGEEDPEEEPANVSTITSRRQSSATSGVAPIDADGWLATLCLASFLIYAGI
ncbi:hypothetical protein LPJ56_007093 [Coemansia sp. RSA 2599]|nr:hypothetical protein LPJ56_007093 [Coemansia sp. RSA 2599]